MELRFSTSSMLHFNHWTSSAKGIRFYVHIPSQQGREEGLCHAASCWVCDQSKSTV